MNGDLSLSQSLGGLRIANPDREEAIASPTSPASTDDPLARPPPPSSHSSGDTITLSRNTNNLLSLAGSPAVQEEDDGGGGGGLGWNPETYSYKGSDSPATSNASREGTSTGQYPQESVSGYGTQQAQPLVVHRSSATPLEQQQQQYGGSYSSSYSQGSIRQPSQSMRPVSGMYMQPNASSSSGYSNGSYRHRDDVGSSDGSVSGIARSGSRSARGVLGGALGRESSTRYRAGSGGSGPMPPRRNSKRVRATTTEAGVEPYSSSAPMPRTAEEWRERGAAVASRQEKDASGQTQTRVIKKGVKDFNFGRTLGEGSYSTVLAATDRQTLKEYAIKVLDKRHIIKEKKVKYVNIERDTLNRLTEHPGIVRLYYTFQDERSLYFVLDLASGGELLSTLKKMGSFDMECTRFYGAQILDSVAYMHSRGVIHRDLKPENVLLDRDMHVKITDFGTAKILPDPKANGTGGGEYPGDPTDGAKTDRAVSFVGTAEYVSPELLRDKNACKASDLWAFGCIIYQLLAGRPPFKAANEYLTFQKILTLEYSFPDGFPEVARDLIERLLVLEPANRLPVEHIKNHRFFDGVTWGKGLWRQKAPRLKAYVPPPAEPIKLNGASKNTAAAGAAAAMGMLSPTSSSNAVPQLSTNGTVTPRPQLRGITELPPPSQLDIDWSPVLTKQNERILKLGNLIVCTGPHNAQTPGDPGTPSEKPKFRSFFSGAAQKRRERLVLITSAGRIVIAAAGSTGSEKKVKGEVSILTAGTAWRNYVDAKGLTGWSLDTKDKHYTFEDPRATTADPAGSKYSTAEWLDAIEQSREVALAQQTSMSSSYSGDSLGLNNSGVSSPADSIGNDVVPERHHHHHHHHHNMRTTLRKGSDLDLMGGELGTADGGKGRKRFSKRHSKSGLAAVF